MYVHVYKRYVDSDDYLRDDLYPSPLHKRQITWCRPTIMTWKILPRSYIPIITFIITTLSSTYSFPVIFRKSFKNSTSKKSYVHQLIFLLFQLNEFCHVFMILEWFYIQKSSHQPLWKSVMMTYFLASISIISIAKWILFRRQNEVKVLVEQALELERVANGQLSSSQVRLVPIMICAVLVASSAIIPSAIFVLVLWRPCMPPLISMGLKKCTSWSGSGGLSFLEKLGIAFFEAFSWWDLGGAVVVALTSLIVYPAVIEEMWVEVVERY